MSTSDFPENVAMPLDRKRIFVAIALVLLAFCAGVVKSYVDETKQSEREQEILQIMRGPGQQPHNELRRELGALRGNRWVDDLIYGSRTAAVALIAWVLAGALRKKRWCIYLAGFLAFAQLPDKWSRDWLTVIFGLGFTGYFGLIVVLLAVITADND